MVNIISAAHAVVTAYSAAIALGGNYSYPLPKLADTVSSFFLPNYTVYTLGEQVSHPPVRRGTQLRGDNEHLQYDGRMGGEWFTII
jgi:hypothetical protein